jgi:hypothetical protein
MAGWLTQQAAEKSKRAVVLKGRGFSRAVMALYFQYPERASAREGSAFGGYRDFFRSLLKPVVGRFTGER